MDSVLQLRSNQYWQPAPSRILIHYVIGNEGGKLSPRELQLKYMSALSRITGAPADADAKRQTPIFQREPAVTEKELIQNAANALAALWKLRDPIKP
jgi:hypothetical protein